MALVTGVGRDQAVTAVAALPSHLALGTTSGAVFWHDRAADSLQRLDVFPGVEVTCPEIARIPADDDNDDDDNDDDDNGKPSGHLPCTCQHHRLDACSWQL